MRALAFSLVISLGLGACALGYRGVVEVEAEYGLTDIDAVRLELPDTPIAVVGAPTAETLYLPGFWSSVGGTAKAAGDYAASPRLDFAVDGRFAALTAVIPVDARDLVDLEVDTVTLPSDRDLEVWTGLGDVQVTHVDGNISIDVGVGNVEVIGGAGGVAVRTGEGDIDVITPGNVDGHTRRGHVHVTQEGVGGNDVVMTAVVGDIEVDLAADANLDLEIAAGGDIRVQTRTVSTVTSGRFSREVGNGGVKVWLQAPYGHVTVRLREDASP